MSTSSSNPYDLSKLTFFNILVEERVIPVETKKKL